MIHRCRSRRRALAAALLACACAMLAFAGNSMTWTRVATQGPSVRCRHAMATDTDRGRVVMFGGWAGEALGDTWEWDGVRWKKMNPLGARPVARRLHAMTYDSHRHHMILFGGCDEDDDPLDDTWAWDGVRWTLLSTIGPDVYGHAMAFDAARRRIVLFGGFEEHEDEFDDQTSDDTWQWNGTTWTKVSSDGPDGRWLHAMAYDESRQRIVLVGGEVVFFDAEDWDNDIGEWEIETVSDIWEWNGQTWIFRSEGQIPATREHAMAWDEAQQRVIMFGGRNDDTFLRTTRMWTGQAMETVSTTGPSARAGSAMAFDPVSQATLLHGGRGSKFWKDTWAVGP